MLVLPKVSSQQEPQLGEFQLLMAGAAPMFGKRGREPNVSYRVARPFEPSEQATALIEVSPLSYAGSYESESPATSVQTKARVDRMVRGLKCIAALGEAMLPPAFSTSEDRRLRAQLRRRILCRRRRRSSLADFTRLKKHRRFVVKARCAI